jgi:uncharacterized protein YjbI with pentapeptide repeats
MENTNMADEIIVERLNAGTPFRAIAARKADLSNATIRGDFDNAVLDMLDFSGARLKGSTFRGATFAGCILDGSDWTNCDFQNASIDSGSLRGIRNAHRAKNLTTVVVNRPGNPGGYLV